jgi:cell division septum initiation protein DivIVA
MADMSVANGVLDTRLEIVKRGFDPQQVKALVGSLSAELRALDAENNSLRQQLDVAKLSASVTTSRATDDIINSWTRETSEMLDGARQHVSRIMEKANADAAAVLAAAEADAATIRRDARAEAARITAEADAAAAQARTGVDERLAAEIAQAEQRAATIIAAAERRADDEAVAAKTIRADAQAELQRATVEVQRIRLEIAELEHERLVLREQFVNTRVYLDGLVSLIEQPKKQAES